MTGDCRSAIITDAGLLEELAPAWWELWRRSPGATPFTSPAWALAWWRVFAPGELRAAAVWSGGCLIALAPLWREDGPYGARLLPIGLGISDGLDVLLDPGEPDAAPRLIEAVCRHRADWDCWELEELGPGAAAFRLPAPADCRDETCAQSASPVLDLTKGADALDCIPGGKRRKLRMARNRVARRGGEIGVVEARGVADFLGHLARLHGARWMARGEDGVLAEDLVRRFHAEALPGLVAAGVARLFTLTIEGQVVGAYYGLLHGPRAFAYIGGFDPAFAFESPGTVLIGHAIEDAVAAGAQEFDFLRGQEPYKYEWGAADRWSRRRSFRRVPHD